MRDLWNASDFSQAIKLAAQSPSAHVRGLFERFLPDDQRVETLGASGSAGKILAVKGDAKRGAELLSPTGKGASCLACRFINGNGRDFGPELSKVGARLQREQIIESLLTPSKVITQNYAAMMIELNDGTTQLGFVVLRKDGGLSLKLPTSQTVTLRTSDVKSEKLLPVSLMPEGQLQSFTAQEAADLVEYLGSMK